VTQLHPAKSFGFRVHGVPHRQARSVMVQSTQHRHMSRLGHLDATIIKMLDGARAYVHAVIDNFSRPRSNVLHRAFDQQPFITCGARRLSHQLALVVAGVVVLAIAVVALLNS
jgi:hypothetical protein